MNELKVFNFNQVDVVDSREVAVLVEKRHNDLLRDIRGYIEIMEKSGERKIAHSDFFIKSSYQSEQNKEMPCYLLTKKGCDMVANKMTGEKGVLFTAAYVTAFEKMREKVEQEIRCELVGGLIGFIRPISSKVERLAHNRPDWGRSPGGPLSAIYGGLYVFCF